jgi:hypothetical protein
VADDESTLIFKVTPWTVRGERMNRFALHVHGDAEAFALKDEIAQSFATLAEEAVAGPRLDLAELDVEVRRIGAELGLYGSAEECWCFRDPLSTVVDASLRRPSSATRLAQ